MMVRDESREQSKDVNSSSLCSPLSFLSSTLVSSLFLQCRRRFGRYQRAGNYLLDYKGKEWVLIDRKIERNSGGQRENTFSCLICLLCISFPVDVTVFGDQRREVITEKEVSCNGQMMSGKTQTQHRSTYNKIH